MKVVSLPGLPPGGDIFDWLQAGGDPATIGDMEAAPTDAPEAEATDGLGDGTWFADVTLGSEEMLIERNMPARAYVGDVRAALGGAKTFLGVEMAARGALGQPVLGEAVIQPFGSLYCVGEKQSQFAKRVEAWRLANEKTGLPQALRVRWTAPNLLDPNEVGSFIAEVNALKPAFEARGAPLGAIWLDTLARSLKHRNVSDPDAAGEAIEAIQHIIEACGVTVVTLAHIAKAEGASDAEEAPANGKMPPTRWCSSRRKGTERLRTVSLAKQADEADGLAWAFELEVVDVGQTPSGRRVTSCVIKQVALPDSGTFGHVPRLTQPDLLVLTALGRLLDAGHGEPIEKCPGGAGEDRGGVTLDRLREQTLLRSGLSAATRPPPDAPKTEHGKWLERRRKAFQRSVERVQQAVKARQEGDLIVAALTTTGDSRDTCRGHSQFVPLAQTPASAAVRDTFLPPPP